jgi:hypothetical protein
MREAEQRVETSAPVRPYTEQRPPRPTQQPVVEVVDDSGKPLKPELTEEEVLIQAVYDEVWKQLNPVKERLAWAAVTLPMSFLLLSAMQLERLLFLAQLVVAFVLISVIGVGYAKRSPAAWCFALQLAIAYAISVPFTHLAK